MKSLVTSHPASVATKAPRQSGGGTAAPPAIRTRPGNTLVIAILITTLFILMVVGVMTLIVQGSLNIAALESATRANYGAESGVEIASLWLRDHQPGFQDQATFSLGTGGNTVDVEVGIAARAHRWPRDMAKPWHRELGKLETASIPLFYDSGTRGQINPPSIASLLNGGGTPPGFTLEFDPAEDPQFQWTVFGFDGNESESVTGCVGGTGGNCSAPTGSIDQNISGKFNKRDGSVDPTDVPIRDFLSSHTQAYLVINNVNPEGKPLRYRITYSGDATCATANGCLSDDRFTVTSTGRHGSYAQTQRAEIPLGEFLPFFHFAIFSPG